MDTPMKKVETATSGPRGYVYATRAEACAAWLVELIGPRLQFGEARAIVRKRGEVMRLLEQMDIED